MRNTKHELNEQEIHEIVALVDKVKSRHNTVDDYDFLKNAELYAHELPLSLKKSLVDFKVTEEKGYCLVSGFPVDESIGLTPHHWNHRPDVSPTWDKDIFFFLCGTILGEPFAWSTQQGGYLIHEVVPMKQHETDQLGFSSQQYLTWHNEDAFHEYRPDYLGLMCLRNPTKTPTLLSYVSEDHELSEYTDALFRKEFQIMPDESHLQKNRVQDAEVPSSETGETLDQAYESMEKRNEDPDPISVFFGDKASPYIRMDPYFMKDPEQGELKEALQAVTDHVEKNLFEVTLKPGDLFFVDNFKLVHGRSPFKANYDGKDRWLKRINITRDLRKSRGSRISAIDRKIF